jgi:hypothetical protein
MGMREAFTLAIAFGIRLKKIHNTLHGTRMCQSEEMENSDVRIWVNVKCVSI